MTAGWIELLRKAVADEAQRLGHKRGAIKNVSAKIGMSRSAVSTAIAGKYPGKTERIAGRVIAVYGAGLVLCPYLKADLPVPECVSWRKRAMPRSNPDALRHWQACRNCPTGLGVQKAAPKTEETA